MKKALLIIFLATLLQTAWAQSALDGIMFSQVVYQGSARSQAMAGAVGAMGNDFGCVAINPAGMGLYRCRGEISITPGLSFCSTASSYFGNTEKDFKGNFNLSNLGIVLSREASNYGTLRFWQVGFGMNRTNNFNSKTLASGINSTSSIVDSYFNEIDGMSVEELIGNYSYLPAWNAHIIDTLNGIYTTPVPAGNLTQTRELRSKGHADEWTLAGSMNLIDKVFLGASIGISHISRTNDYSFTEENVKSGEFFREWTTSEYVKTSGFGINVGIGIVAFPIKWMRFGLAYHSPTRYTLKETWEPSAMSVLNGQTYSSSQDLYTSYGYNLRTPHRFGVNLAFIIGTNGIITADYEFQSYRQAKFSANDWDYSKQNEEIKIGGKPASNVRIGTEWVLNNLFLRGGFAFYGSPYAKENENIGNTFVYSAGIGYTFSSYFGMDLSYSLIDGKSSIIPYKFEGVSPINERQMRHNVALSLKLKW